MIRRAAGIRLAALALVALTLAGCSAGTESPETPQVTGLTTEQAERLAITRFRNFDAGVREITLTVTGVETGDIVVTGWYDYATHTGYGSATSAADPVGLVWWNDATIATLAPDAGETGEQAPLPLPEGAWQSGDLDPSSTFLANALALVTNLGSDRPENPQLLAQSDAAFLESDEIDGTAVDVFIGPSAEGAPESTAPATAGADLSTRARYWVDADGTLVRFESPLGATASGETTVDFGPSTPDIELPETAPAAQ